LKRHSMRIATLTILALLVSGQVPLTAQAAAVTLAWDESTDTSVVAYHIYCRKEGQSYNYSQPTRDVSVTSCTIDNLDPDTTYFFVARAVNSYNLESDNSNEVYFHTAGIPQEDNAPPVADAGSDQTAEPLDVVMLSGTGSSDPDGNIVEYQWEQIDGSAVELSDLFAATTTFEIPENAQNGRMVFRLTVTDNSGDTATDTCTINIAVSSAPPVADAGANQTALLGTMVWLDGSGSSDDTFIASYTWKQISGPAVDLQNDETEMAFFTVPDSFQEDLALVFELIVTDEHGLQAKDQAIVNIRREATTVPPFELGTPVFQDFSEGTTITLEIPITVDSSMVATFLWEQTGGPPVTLSDRTDATPSFVPPPVTVEGATLTFRLTIESNDGYKDSLDYTLQITDNNVSAVSETAIPIVTYDGRSLEIEAVDGAVLTKLTSVDPESIGALSGPPGSIFCGLLDMEIVVNNPGDSTTLLITYHEPLPSNCGWFKYTSESGWYNYSDYIQTDHETNQIQLTLTDGGAGDDDGIANGLIVDPSGLVFDYPAGASPVNQDSSGGAASGGSGGGCFIQSALSESGSPFCSLLLVLFTILSAFFRLRGLSLRSFAHR